MRPKGAARNLREGNGVQGMSHGPASRALSSWEVARYFDQMIGFA